jgi:copper chaperone CopZ
VKLGSTNTVALIAAAVLLAAGTPWLASQFRTLPGQRRLAERANQRVVTLEVMGMHCPACVASVHDRLAELPGVSSADVRLQAGRAYVVCDRAVPDSALVGAVSRAGPSFVADVERR